MIKNIAIRRENITKHVRTKASNYYYEFLFSRRAERSASKQALLFNLFTNVPSVHTHQNSLQMSIFLITTFVCFTSAQHILSLLLLFIMIAFKKYIFCAMIWWLFNDVVKAQKVLFAI